MAGDSEHVDATGGVAAEEAGARPAPAAGDLGAVMLATALRAAGLRIGAGQVVTCRQAVRVLGDGTADRYWAARTTLVSDPRDIPTFERVFQQLEAMALGSLVPSSDRAPHESPPTPSIAPESQTEVVSDRAGDAPSSRPRPAPDATLQAGLRASPDERLRHRRFDQATPAERAEIDRLIDQLPAAIPRRRGRRRRPGVRGELDLARTLARSLDTDGELIARAHQVRRTQPRRLVLLLDVSGSMAGYARALLRFAVAVRRSADREVRQHVEVFAFATRLTRLSEALGRRDPDAAIAAAAEAVTDWDAGTRIGASVDELVRVWGRRGLLRGAVVVVCSDGLERGDPAVLAAAVARLRRSVHRIIWVNPLAGDGRYEPTQRGMRAALPYLDVFLPGHDLGAVEELAGVLRDVG